jgi:uncharacterized protein involved in exopolysaccharide biosynthesis
MHSKDSTDGTAVPLRYRYIRSALLASLIAIIITLALPQSYRSDAAFYVQNRRTPSSLTGLAAQLGVNIPASDVGQSPAFFEALVRSNEILVRTVLAVTTTADKRDTFRLIDRWSSPSEDSTARVRTATRRLSELVQTSWDTKSGIISVSARSTHSSEAQAIAASLLAQVDSFNVLIRNSQARYEREFTERRLKQATSELRLAEDRLEVFLQRNRGSFLSAPELEFQRDRLAREIGVRQQTFAALTQAHEQARLDEVRDTPVISSMSALPLPPAAESRYLLLKALIALVLGASIHCLIRAWRGLPTGLATLMSSTEVAELTHRLAADLRAPRRTFGFVLRSGW